MPRDDVIVIGAGLAGLNAALELESAGCSVRVLEAQARVGGRIHSMRQLGANAEAGATYIGVGYRRLIAATRRYGVELIDVTPLLEFFREQDLVLGTEIIAQRAWRDHPANPFPEADKALPPWSYHRVLTIRENPLASPAEWLDPRWAALDISMREWMLGLGLDEQAVALGYNINPSFGADADDVSALMLLARGAFSKAQRPTSPEAPIGYTARDGVASIPEAMTRALSREPELGREVTSIRLEAHRARVECADGSRYEAAHVISAVPLPVLAELAIDPPLEGAQAMAVAALPSQALTQIYLHPRSPFWERDGHSASLYTDSTAGMIAAARNGRDQSEVTGITAWIMGRNAERLDRLPPDDAAADVIATIERLRPAAKGQLEPIGVQSWGRDPYARGAWTYFRPGQVARHAARLGAPHGRLHFCGEHLARAARGMEAAMESGERAAAEILAR